MAGRNHYLSHDAQSCVVGDTTLEVGKRYHVETESGLAEVEILSFESDGINVIVNTNLGPFEASRLEEITDKEE